MDNVQMNVTEFVASETGANAMGANAMGTNAMGANAMDTNAMEIDKIIQIDCSVCAEKYNNSTHKLIACEYGDCNFMVCKACIRMYLLNTTADPNCMQCKKVWTEQFIVLHLNRSFITNDYKIHRRKLLLDREISKMPETMHAAEKYKLIDHQKIITADLNEKLKEARRLCVDLQQKVYESYGVLNRLKTGKEVVVSERKKFIMPCPNNDCRGYLSSQYKCELCNLHTCSACHELIGYRKDEPHTCKEENVQSAELIKKDTKPCPTCGTRISKISGCDQMWCPECHKAFSWNTGLVDNGIIHNPHFYQYQREQAGTNAVPRNPGDVVCGGLCEWYVFSNQILRKISCGTLMPDQGTDLRPYLSDIHRFVAHITHVDLENARTKIRDLSEFQEIRCKYILKQISKEDLAKTIYRNDALRKKLTEMLHIFELLSVVGTELFAKLLASINVKESFASEVIVHVGEYNKLREYCNKQFKAISLTYNQTVPCVSKMWTITTKKYTFTLKRVKKDTATTDEVEQTEA